MMNWDSLNKGLENADVRSLARAITGVENDLEGYLEFMKSLNIKRNIPIIGITGPPGAGKSTLVNVLISELDKENKKIGIVAIDPTSPFHFGSLLGDRIRMAEHFLNQNVYIRSLATRGSLGGLSAKTIEITDVMRAFDFDYIIVETVGVGQSEIEIVGLADVTVLVLVPEAGDEIQGIKSGVMEIADVFVVNKADREGADSFVSNIKKMLHERAETIAPPSVVKTIASCNEGISELKTEIEIQLSNERLNSRKNLLIAEKAYRLIQTERMKSVNKKELLNQITIESAKEGFNLYRFLEKYY